MQRTVMYPQSVIFWPFASHPEQQGTCGPDPAALRDKKGGNLFQWDNYRWDIIQLLDKIIVPT